MKRTGQRGFVLARMVLIYIYELEQKHGIRQKLKKLNQYSSHKACSNFRQLKK